MKHSETVKLEILEVLTPGKTKTKLIIHFGIGGQLVLDLSEKQKKQLVEIGFN